MKPAQFEEKEYEAALYNQLDGGKTNLWSPGQALESYLGFDHAVYLDDPYLWRMLGIARVFRGFAPWYSRWRFLPKKHRDRLPRFRLNCFIQAKRPDYGSRSSRRLEALGSERPIFRFSVDDEQQKVLNSAAQKFGKRALFAYAAPVFFESRDLFRHTTSGTVAQNSTFPDVALLARQHAWYYNKPGAEGVVNQAFEPRRSLSFEERIEEMLRENAEVIAEPQSPSDGLAELSRNLQQLFHEDEELAGFPRVAKLAMEWRTVSNWARDYDLPPAIESYFRVDAFVTAFNLTWLTVA